MPLQLPVPPPYTEARYDKQYENGGYVRRLGHTSCDYRRSHIEAMANLKAGESIFNIPVMADNQGTIKAIRIRSRSEKLKVTLCSSPVYDTPGKDVHPRSIIWQRITEEKDEMHDFESLYVYMFDTQQEIKTWLSIENLGADTDGVYIDITFGY